MMAWQSQAHDDDPATMSARGEWGGGIRGRRSSSTERRELDVWMRTDGGLL